MSLWQSLKRLLDPAAGLVDDSFSLGNRGSKPAAEESGPARLAGAQIRAESVLTRIDSLLEATEQGPKAVEAAGDLVQSLDENVKRLKKLFRMPTNKDLVIREFVVATQPPTKAVIAFMEGLSDKTVQNDNILQPLMLLSHLDHHVGRDGEHGKTEFSIETVLQRLLPGHQTSEAYDFKSIADGLLAGDSVLLFEGQRTGILIETKSPPTRSVGEPKLEQTVVGPQDAFTEAFRVNVALVRRRLKDPRVVTEILTVGQLSNTFVALMYIDGLTSPKLIAEARRRIEAIDVDIVSGGGVLEQYIEDAPSSLFPTTMTTERPDRTAAYLAEGHVAVFVDTTPSAKILPTTLWSQLQTPEDYYIRWPFGSFLRYLRVIALIITLTAPAIYLAVVNYHQEMIPTELMLFIASSRESVPLPSVVELVTMDIAFELIREATTRIPSLIGPTMGLVASLVLGQAAVEAKIISPLVILVVALSGLTSFAVPNYVTSYGVRALRFLLLGASVILGFYGFAAAVFLAVLYLAGMRSFGVPYLSPLAPMRPTDDDIISRPHMFEMETRPAYTRPLNNRRQKEIIRSWDPVARQAAKQDDQADEQEGGDKE